MALAVPRPGSLKARFLRLHRGRILWRDAGTSPSILSEVTMGSFVGTSANGGNVTALTTANSAAITWPAGVQSGDIAILAWTFQSTATPTDPTSQAFTLVGQVDDGSCRS